MTPSQSLPLEGGEAFWTWASTRQGTTMTEPAQHQPEEGPPPRWEAVNWWLERRGTDRTQVLRDLGGEFRITDEQYRWKNLRDAFL